MISQSAGPPGRVPERGSIVQEAEEVTLAHGWRTIPTPAMTAALAEIAAEVAEEPAVGWRCRPWSTPT